MLTKLVCPECRGTKFSDCTLANTGKVVTYTVQHVAGGPFTDQTPFAVGIIEMDDGVRIMAQIVDVPRDSLKCGLAVRLVTRKVQEGGDSGVIAYSYKAVPLT